MHINGVVKLFSRTMTCSLCVLKQKTLRLALPTSSCNRKEKIVRSSVFPRIDAKNIDREVQPKRPSFSGKMEVACAPNYQVRVVS